MLELRGVSTRYGPNPMLRQVSVELREGEIACLLGPNGAGKTTLIRTILGIVRPVAGAIFFRGERIDGVKTNRIVGRGIGVVPEGRRIFPKMTVQENLRMGAFAEWGTPRGGGAGWRRSSRRSPGWTSAGGRSRAR